MPEGDAVARTARRLHRALADRVIEHAELRWGHKDSGPLIGARTVEGGSFGKHLLHRTDSGWTLHTHLRMEGSWRVVDRTSLSRRQLSSPDLRVALATDADVALGWKLGAVDLVRTQDEHTLIGPLGPDLLGPDWDVQEALRRLARQPNRLLAEALLDQRNLAGLGTIYTSEPLFLRRLSPWRSWGSLHSEQALELVGTAQRLLKRGLAAGRPSFTGDPREPTFVFDRAGRPCRRCGTTIRTSHVGTAPRERILAYCPRCQGGLAPNDDGRPARPLGARVGWTQNPGRR